MNCFDFINCFKLGFMLFLDTKRKQLNQGFVKENTPLTVTIFLCEFLTESQ